MDIHKTGEFLAALRKSQGYTQQEVADHFNISNKTISKWEQGSGYPDMTMLPVLAEFYHVTVDEILAGEKSNRQTEPDRRRGDVLRRHLLGRMDLHFDLCMIGVFVFALLAGLFAYTIWCTLFNILAGGMLLVGILVSRYELLHADGALEKAEQGKISRAVGQKTFLAMGLILWSSLFISYLNCDALEKVELRAHIWAGAYTAAMVILWISGQRHWGTFFNKASGIFCAAGLIILNISAPVCGRVRDMFFVWMTGHGYAATTPEGSRIAHRIVLLIHFIGVALIAVGVIWQLVQDRRKSKSDIDPAQDD